MFKLNKLFKSTIIKEVEVQEIWLVSWRARYGYDICDWNTKIKAFSKESDAKDFISQLQYCKKMIQYSEDICIRLEKKPLSP